jgi:hypothetical protein
MVVLAALIADMHAQAPDHIACTGDLCNIGLPSEWRTSRVFMEGLGPPDRVSLVPGNHDAYVEGSLEGLLAECAPWVAGDDGAAPHFPYLRRRGPVAFVGMSSAVPTPPFVANGTAGRAQIKAAGELLTQLGRDPHVFRIVLIHHPPHVGGAPSGRNLTDARAFEAMIARAGAELVLADWRMVNVPRLRRVLSHGAGWFARRALGLDAHCVSSFFRVYSAPLLQRGFDRYGDSLIRERGFACKAELLAKLAALGARIEEVPVALDTTRRIGESKMPILRTTLAYWRLLARVRNEVPA